MDSYIRQHYCQTRRIIEWSIIGGLFFFQFSPITNITVRFIFLLVFLLSCLFQKSFHQINNVRFLILISLTTIFLIFYHGLAVAKDFFIFCFGILSTSYFAKRYPFTGNIIYKFFIYVIIPLSVLNLLLYHNVHYLPFKTGYINIIGNVATKHNTATIGTFLFIGASYNILKFKKEKIIIDYIFLILALYLVVFSGSRSCLLALIATILLYVINLHKFNKAITYIFFVIMISSVFFFEYLQNYVYLIKNEFILDLIKADNFRNYGVTSGRAWLWSYHWDTFINSSFLLGGGREVVDFSVDEYVPFLRMRVPAGSESPFTGLLASCGLIAFIMYGILFYLSFKAIESKNLIATCLIFISIYNTTMGVDLSNVLHYNSIFIYLLYFSSFNCEKTMLLYRIGQCDLQGFK